MNKLKKLDGERITAKSYISVSIFILFIIIVSFISFFSEKQSPFLYLMFISVVMLLFFLEVCFLNFIDIYITAEEKYLIGYFGKKLEEIKILKIRKIPATMKMGATRYTVASFYFVDSSGKGKLKFFMIDSRGWYLIDEMKLKGID